MPPKRKRRLPIDDDVVSSDDVAPAGYDPGLPAWKRDEAASISGVSAAPDGNSLSGAGANAVAPRDGAQQRVRLGGWSKSCPIVYDYLNHASRPQ